MTYRSPGRTVFNVKDAPFFATGNGTTDDTTAIQAAINAAGSAGITSIPVGTYKITSSLSLTGDGIFRGAGTQHTTLLAGTSSMTMLLIQSPGSVSLTFEDMTLDAANIASLMVSATGLYFNDLTFRRCAFKNIPSAYGIIAQFCLRLLIEDCTFDGNGKGLGTGIGIVGSAENITVSHCTFRGLHDGIELAPGTSQNTLDNVTVENCFFDGMFYTAPALAGITGSGGGVTYTSTTITDTAQNFVVTGVEQPGTLTQFGYIRAMPVRATGTITTSVERTQLIDSAAHFTTDGIIPGEIVRAGAFFAIIRSVESDTVLNIEEWLSNTDRTYTSPPFSGQSYIVYGILLMKVGNTPGTYGHTLTAYGFWSDLLGNFITPSTGTLYEGIPISNYPFDTSDTIRNLRIVGNTIYRSYSDAISIFGDNAIIAHNVIQDCQDVGITLGGIFGRHIVHDNFIFRQGTQGIVVASQTNAGLDVNVHNNTVVGWGARALTSNNGTYGIDVSGMAGFKIHDNTLDGYGLPASSGGITLSTCSDGYINDNVVISLNGTQADIVYGPSVTGCNIRHATSSVIPASGNAGQLLSVKGIGSPAGTLTAAPGSIYIDIAAGLQYVKSTGFGASGWVVGSAPTGTAGGDLAGTYPNPTVVQITGSSGTVSLLASNLSWAASTSSPSLLQLTQTSDIATNNLTITSQAPFASASVHTSPGNIALTVPSPVGSGAAGKVQANVSGHVSFYADNQGVVLGRTDSSQFGMRVAPLIGQETTFVGVWTGASATAPGSLNWKFAFQSGSSGTDYWQSTNLQLQAASTIEMGTANNIIWSLSGVTTATVAFNTPFTLTQATPGSDVATQNMLFQSQAPFASAVSNLTPGNIVFSIPPPVGAGADGALFVQTTGVANFFAVKRYNLLAGSGVIYLGSSAVAPSISNYHIYGDSANVISNGASANILRVANADVINSTSSLITITPATVEWVAGAVTPGITQASPVSDVAANPLTIRAQAAEAAAVTNLTGGNIVLAPGIGATTNGTPGNVVANIPAPTGSGTEGGFQVQRAGSPVWTMQTFNAAPSFYMLYAGGNTGGNYTLLVEGGNNSTAVLNALTGGSVFLAVAQVVSLGVTSTTIQSYVQTLQWAATTAAPIVTQLQQANASNPNNFTIAPQAPGASATNSTTGTPGSLVVNIAAPVNGGAEGAFLLQRAGVDTMHVGTYPGTGFQGIWLGETPAASPGANNYTILAQDSGANTYVNAGNQVNIAVANAGFPISANTTGITFFGNGSNTYGGGANILAFLNGTAPTNGLSGKVLNWVSGSNAFNILASTDQPVSLTAGTSPGVSQAAQATDTATNAFTIQAQSAFASATVNVTGGNLILAPGAGATTNNGTSGSVLVNLAAPQLSGSHATLRVSEGSTRVWEVGVDPSDSASMTVWGMTASPSGSNYLVKSDGSSTVLNAPSASGLLHLAVNTTNEIVIGEVDGTHAHQVGFFGQTTFGSGVGVIGIANVTTAPSSAPSGGIAIWASTLDGYEAFNTTALTSVIAAETTYLVVNTVATFSATDGNTYAAVSYAHTNHTVTDWSVTVIGRNNGGGSGAEGDYYRADLTFTVEEHTAGTLTMNPVSPTPANVRTQGGGSSFSTSAIVNGSNVEINVTGASGVHTDWSIVYQVQQRG